MNKEDIDFLMSIQDLEQPDFDNACLERENKRLNKEIARLNYIINELEAMFDGDLDGFFTINEKGACNEIIEVIQNYKDKLKALKEENK